VRKCSLWKDLYALLERNLLKLKEVIENHIWVEEASIMRHEPLCFYQMVEYDKPFKQNRSPSKDNNSKKGQKRPVKDHI
jgi:hypothetical protein